MNLENDGGIARDRNRRRIGGGYGSGGDLQGWKEIAAGEFHGDRKILEFLLESSDHDVRGDKEYDDGGNGDQSGERLKMCLQVNGERAKIRKKNCYFGHYQNEDRFA